MEITNVRIIKEAKAETSVARYTLEYIVTNGLLERIVANVNKLMQDEDGNELYREHHLRKRNNQLFFTCIGTDGTLF